MFVAGLWPGLRPSSSAKSKVHSKVNYTKVFFWLRVAFYTILKTLFDLLLLKFTLSIIMVIWLMCHFNFLGELILKWKLTFHKCIVFGHPGGYHSIFTKAIDFWQLADSFLTLMPAMKQENIAEEKLKPCWRPTFAGNWAFILVRTEWRQLQTWALFFTKINGVWRQHLAVHDSRRI